MKIIQRRVGPLTVPRAYPGTIPSKSTTLKAVESVPSFLASRICHGLSGVCQGFVQGSKLTKPLILLVCHGVMGQKEGGGGGGRGGKQEPAIPPCPPLPAKFSPGY